MTEQQTNNDGSGCVFLLCVMLIMVGFGLAMDKFKAQQATIDELKAAVERIEQKLGTNKE